VQLGTFDVTNDVNGIPGYPADIEAGDTLIASIFAVSANSTNDIATPSGWTKQGFFAGNRHGHWIFTKVADGTETGTQTFAFSADASSTAGIIARVRNAAFQQAQIGSINQSWTAPAITTTTIGGLLTFVWNNGNQTAVAISTAAEGDEILDQVATAQKTAAVVFRLTDAIGVQTPAAGSITGNNAVRSAASVEIG